MKGREKEEEGRVKGYGEEREVRRGRVMEGEPCAIYLQVLATPLSTTWIKINLKKDK